MLFWSLFSYLTFGKSRWTFVYILHCIHMMINDWSYNLGIRTTVINSSSVYHKVINIDQCGTRLKQKNHIWWHFWVEISIHFSGIEISTIKLGDQVDPKSILMDIICHSAQERFGINDLYISEKDPVVLKHIEKNLLYGDVNNNALDVLETTP